jgi:hypothetical protein
MIADITTRIEGSPAVHSMEIASWEPKAQQIVHVILGPGENGSGVWSREGDDTNSMAGTHSHPDSQLRFRKH